MKGQTFCSDEPVETSSVMNYTVDTPTHLLVQRKWYVDLVKYLAIIDFHSGEYFFKLIIYKYIYKTT